MECAANGTRLGRSSAKLSQSAPHPSTCGIRALGKLERVSVDATGAAAATCAVPSLFGTRVTSVSGSTPYSVSIARMYESPVEPAGEAPMLIPVSAWTRSSTGESGVTPCSARATTAPSFNATPNVSESLMCR